MRGKVLLCCEGEEDQSNDAKFYRKLFDSAAFATETLVKSLGGKEGIRSAARGYTIGRQAYTPDIRLIIVDRDFDVLPRFEESQLRPQIDARGQTFHVQTGRSCLESYLLDPDRLKAYVVSSDLNYSENEIDDALGHAIGLISTYQATRWALSSQLREWFPGTMKFRTSWMPRDGELPEDLAIEYCSRQAVSYRDGMADQLGNTLDLQAEIDFYLQKFTRVEFLANAEYMHWFHGKDLQAALSRSLNGFPFRKFYERCIEDCDLAAFEDLKSIEETVMRAA